MTLKLSPCPCGDTPEHVKEADGHSYRCPFGCNAVFVTGHAVRQDHAAAEWNAVVEPGLQALEGAAFDLLQREGPLPADDVALALRPGWRAGSALLSSVLVNRGRIGWGEGRTLCP